MGVLAPVGAPAGRVENIALMTDAYALVVSAAPLDITSGDLFALSVAASPAVGGAQAALDHRVTLSVTAAMPEHEHGMDTVSRVSRDGDVFAVEGMLLQMPGRWEVYFDLTDRGVTERAVLELNVR